MRLSWLTAFLFVGIAHGQGSPPLDVQTSVSTAFARRSAVRAAELRLRQAGANRLVLGAALPTRLEFGRGTTPDVGGGEDLLLAQPIDVFGRAAAGAASGLATVESARAALRQTQLDVQSEVLAAYAEAQSAQALVATGRALRDLAERLYEATKARVDNGEVPPSQLLRVDLDRERARQTLAVRERSLTAARIRLAGAMGMGPESVREVDLADPAPIDPGLHLRPDLQQLAADVRAAHAEVRQGRLAGLPELELQFRRAPWSTSEQYGARLQIVMPLWDWGATKNRVRAAQAGERAAQASLVDRQIIANNEVAAAQADLDSARLAVASFAHLVADARSLRDKEQRGFELGASTLLDVLDASRALREIEEGAIDAHLRLSQAHARLLAATGTILGEAK